MKEMVSMLLDIVRYEFAYLYIEDVLARDASETEVAECIQLNYRRMFAYYVYK